MSSVEAEHSANVVSTQTGQVTTTYLPPLTACEGLTLENFSLQARGDADLFSEEFRALPVMLRLMFDLIPYTREYGLYWLGVFCCWWGGGGRGRVNCCFSRLEATWR